MKLLSNRSVLNRKGLRAFTIIEVLVASAILVLIVFAIYSSWSSILRASSVANRVASEVQRARVAANAIEAALITAQSFAGDTNYTFYPETKDRDFAFLTFVSRLPEGFPGIERFPDRIVRRLTFEVVPGEEGKNELVMRQIPLFQQTNDVDETYSLTLVRDLTWFGLDFWDPQKGEWAAEFTATNQLPRMIRVIIGWGHMPHDQTEPAEVVVRTVALPGGMVMPELLQPR